MKTKITSVVISVILSIPLFGQAPVVYINFVSHNEPIDNLQDSLEYFNSKFKCIEMANLIKNKGASWNIGTCDYFIDGAMNHDGAVMNPNDIFETLSSPIYISNIEIDPRTKNHFGRNAADAVSMINSCGGIASSNLSGFTYYSSNLTQIDWFNYQDTLTGNITGYKWKADILWGAGSIPAHQNDLDDYGIWKPDTIGTNISNLQSNFYNHNPNRSLWYIGNGCTSKLDTLSNEQDFVLVYLSLHYLLGSLSQLRNLVDSIQNGLLPQNKFYSATITCGQDEFGATLFNKIGLICDSINSWGTGKIDWATTSQKFSEFQFWQSNTSLTHSQWLCGQEVTGIENISNQESTSPFPNPTKDQFQFNFGDDQKHFISVYSHDGKLLNSQEIQGLEFMDLTYFSPGMYFVIVDNRKTFKMIKQ